MIVRSPTSPSTSWDTKVNFESDRISECIDEYVSSSAGWAHFSEGAGFRSGDSIEFLADARSIDGVSLLDVSAARIRVIEQMTWLKRLSIPNGCEGLNLSNHACLEELYVCDSRGLAYPPYAAPLKRLHISKLASRHIDLSSLAWPALESVSLVQCRFLSLDGVEVLGRLRKLEMYYCQKLQRLSALRTACVEELTIECCQKIVDYDILGDCSSIKKLRILGVKNLLSIDFLSRMKSIEEVRLGRTPIADGNVEPLMRAATFYCMDARHHNHTMRDLQKIRDK
jgi:hypothetical protein